MNQTSIFVLIILLVAAVGAVTYVVMVARGSKARLAAQLEVLPGMPTGAPVEWAVADSPEAHMHRTLFDLARTVDALQFTGDEELERKVGAENRLAELDSRLIAVGAGIDPARRDAVLALKPEVTALEAEVAELRVLAAARS